MFVLNFLLYVYFFRLPSVIFVTLFSVCFQMESLTHFRPLRPFGCSVVYHHKKSSGSNVSRKSFQQLSILPLKAFTEGADTTSLGSLFHKLTTLSICSINATTVDKGCLSRLSCCLWSCCCSDDTALFCFSAFCYDHVLFKCNFSLIEADCLLHIGDLA